MRSWALLWAAGGVFLALACGSSTHGTTAGGGESQGGSGTASAGHATGGASSSGASAGGASSAAPIEIGDLCPIFTHDLCVYLMQCQGAQYRDAAHCEKELDCFGLPQLTAAAQSGAVDYDPSQVGACHERFLASPCTFGFFLFTPDIYDVLQFCPGTVTPKLEAGHACSSSGECSAGLYCYKGVDYQCPGQCRAFSNLGEDCAGSGRCADGLDCNADKCVPDAKAGDDCSGGCDYSLLCPDDQICAGNLWCDETAGKCQLGRLLGEECGTLGSGVMASHAECAINLWCDAVGVGAGRCQVPSAEGGPCNGTLDNCRDGLHCEGQTPAALGTCQPPSASGGDCQDNMDCQKGLVCLQGKCAEPGAEGASCADGTCQTGLVCADGKCLGARYPGDPCDAGRCTFSRCVNGSCDYHVKVGGACATGDDCATGQCVSGVCYDASVCNAPKP